MTIGLRLCTSKDTTVMHTANAMVSQMVTAVFERVIVENELRPRGNHLKMIYACKRGVNIFNF